MKYINNEQEYKEAINSNKNIIIKYTAQWCGPCKSIQVLLDQISNEDPTITIYGIDVDTSEDLANESGIRSIPTLKYYKEGKFIGESIGSTSKDKILEKFK